MINKLIKLLQQPKLDTLDVFAVTLWLGILVISFQLPLDATFTFIKIAIFLLWSAAFFVYVAVRIYKEKKLVFYSATASSAIAVTIIALLVIGALLSVSKIDSLYGFNLSFSSSVLFLVPLVITYLLLRTAGLSLEFQISRILSAFPISLVIADIISISLFLIPLSFYNKIFGGFSQYVSLYTLSPFALLGELSQTVVLHLFAILVLFGQLQNFDYKKRTLEDVRRLISLVFLTLSTSYLFFFTFNLNFLQGFVFAIILIIVFASFAHFGKPKNKQFMPLVALTISFFLLLGLLWNNLGYIGNGAAEKLSKPYSAEITLQSFRANGVPIWRAITGYGVSTFPYTYMLYRTPEMIVKYGNDPYFYKPASIVNEILFEHGLLGVAIFIWVAFNTIKSFVKASNKKIIALEFSLLLLITYFVFTLSGFTVLYILIMVILASFYDKVESLPEKLPAVRSLEIKETLYTNRSLHRTNQIFLIKSFVYTFVIVLVLYRPFMTILGYSRALTRYNVAVAQYNSGNKEAFTTFENSIKLASSYQKYCKQCSQLTYLRTLNFSMLQNHYLKLTPEEQKKSSDLRKINSSLIVLTNELVTKNKYRHDYWYVSAQVLKNIVETDKSQTLFDQALLSLSGSLANSPNYVPSLYLFIDASLISANSDQSNQNIADAIDKLKTLVGSPVQLRFYEGVLLAKKGKYKEAVDFFTALKDDVKKDNNYTEAMKKQIIDLATSKIDEINAEINKITPSVSVTPTITAKPLPKPSESITPTVTVSVSITPTSNQ